MKKSLFVLGLAFVLGLNANEFSIDSAHSSVEFKVKHLLVSNVGGSFKDFSGKVDIDPKGKKILALEGEISIDSINTDNKQRDNHLKAPDFFNEKKNPKGYFKMTKQEGDQIKGTLTLNGISKEIVLNANLSDIVVHPMNKKNIAALELNGQIKRKDFGIGMGTADTVVGNEVKISINLELVEK